MSPWLPELLKVAHGTGRRLGAICALRFEDRNHKPTQGRPFGSNDWRANHEKEGYNWKDIPLEGTTRAAPGSVLEGE
jgi:hypothetical protein